MKKIILASALVALFATNSCIAGKDNGFASHSQYPNLSLISLDLPSITSNEDKVSFLKWLSKNSAPIKITKIAKTGSNTSIESIIENQKVKFNIDTKIAIEAKMQVLDQIYIKSTKDGYVLFCNKFPIGWLSNYPGSENFKQN